MKIKKTTAVLVVVASLLCMFSLSFSQDDGLKPWERLGLSLTEWKLIQDNDLPMNKVEELLLAGISIGEYFEKPWEELELTESKWIALRRSGQTSKEIAQHQRVQKGDYLKEVTPAENTFEDYDVSSEEKELFTSFFAPGLLQLRDERKVKGRVMIGIAAGSLAGTVAWSISKKQFIPIPLAVVVVDMFWSMGNQKNHKRKKAD